MPKNDHRQIEVVTLESVRGHTISRNRAFVRVDTIAAIIELKEDGPTRFLFTGGGYLDVCGGAEILRREIRLIELSDDES